MTIYYKDAGLSSEAKMAERHAGHSRQGRSERDLLVEAGRFVGHCRAGCQQQRRLAASRRDGQDCSFPASSICCSTGSTSTCTTTRPRRSRRTFAVAAGARRDRVPAVDLLPAAAHDGGRAQRPVGRSRQGPWRAGAGHPQRGSVLCSARRAQSGEHPDAQRRTGRAHAGGGRWAAEGGNGGTGIAGRRGLHQAAQAGPCQHPPGPQPGRAGRRVALCLVGDRCGHAHVQRHARAPRRATWGCTPSRCRMR